MSNRVFVDSINGDHARLLCGREEFVVPRCLLPKGAREGDTLTLNMEIDSAATKEAKKECEDLLNMLIESSGK